MMQTKTLTKGLFRVTIMEFRKESHMNVFWGKQFVLGDAFPKPVDKFELRKSGLLCIQGLTWVALYNLRADPGGQKMLYVDDLAGAMNRDKIIEVYENLARVLTPSKAQPWFVKAQTIFNNLLQH